MEVRELQRLHEVVTRALEAKTVEGIAKLLVDEGMAALGVPIAGVWLLTQDQLEIVHFGGSPTGPWEAVRLDGNSPLAVCVRRGQPEWLPSPAEYASRFPESTARMTAPVACACLPLIADGKAIGGAVFASLHTLELSTAEKTTLSLIARQCAQAIERLRLIDAERAARRHAEQLAQRMNGLQVLAARLAIARGREDVARTTIDASVSTLGTSAAAIWLLEDEPAAVMLAQAGMADEVVAQVSRVGLDDPGPVATTLRNGKALWLSSRKSTEAKVIASRWQGIQAVAIVPLLAEGRLLGALGIAFAEQREFEPSEREIVEAFASHCASALDRLRLIDLERKARVDAEQLAQRMNELQATTARLAAARGIGQTARTIISDVRTALRSSGVGLWLVEDDMAVLCAQEGWPIETFAPGARLSLDDKGLLAATLRARRSMWIDRDEAALRVEYVPERWLRVKSVANVPLITEGRLIGAISVTFDQQRKINIGDRELLDLYALHAAQAIERVRLVEATTMVAGRMTALQATAARFGQARGFDEVARIVIEEATSAIGASTAALWQIEGTDIVLAAHIGSPSTVVEAVSRIGVDAPGALPAAVRTHAPQYLESRTMAAERNQFDAARWAVIEAAAFVPLVAHERLLGVIGLGFAQPRRFDSGEREMIELFAGHAAQAVARDREDRAQRLLAETTSSLAGSLDAHLMLQRVGELIVEEFADWCFVDVAAPEGNLERRIVAHANPDDRALAEKLKDVGAHLTSGVPTVIATQEPLIIERLSQEVVTRTQRNPDAGKLIDLLGAQSVLCVPMSVGGRAIGAITWIARTRTLDAHDLQIAALIARAAAASLENARLYHAEAASARRLSQLNEFAVALSSARTPEEVANVTTRLGADATGAISGFVWLRDEDGVLRVVGAHAPPEWVRKWSALPRDPSLPAYRVIATGEAVWMELVRDYEREAPTAFASAHAAERLNAFAALPLVIGGETRGVLALSWQGDHHFSFDERTLLSAIARSCEQALERAELYVTEALARGAAEAANRTKDEFLAMLGHELRNPLAPITTALDVMRLRGVEDGARERSVIERQVQHLTRLVDDLLDISRITRGKIELRRTQDEIIRAVEPAIEAVTPLLVQHRHQLHVELPPTGLRVVADMQRLSQVVRNLLTNAAKYTPAGGRLEISARADGSHVELVVSDNGHGIAPELLPHVFEPFVQSTQGSERSGGGLGLGLAIVKNIVELHAGSLQIVSHGIGRGTRVTVRLPRAIQTHDLRPARSALTRSGRSLRVLVVDDNLDAATLLAELVRLLGHVPIIANDGEEALVAAAEQGPEFAIIDLGLPGMDGYELVQKLRSDPSLASVPVIALTGYGQPSDRERSRAAGFAEHLVKPINVQQLQAVLERFM